jgi:hypothetical protein
VFVAVWDERVCEGIGMSGRKSKYTPERVQLICDAIAQTGSDESGWKSGGISEPTFYAWQNQFPEFSESVIAAKSEYRATCPETLVRQANKAFADLLFGRMERVATTKRVGHDPKRGYWEEETVTRTPVGVPRWAIERVLGPSFDEMDAIKILVKAGYLPQEFIEVTSEQFSELRTRIKTLFAGILPDLQRSKQVGISDETADAIRAQILGIDKEAQLPPAGS